MTQITSGLRGVLNHPAIYNLFLGLIGSGIHKRNLIRETVCPWPGMRLLDIACGTGAILKLYPETVDYVGFDISAAYIEQARKSFGRRGVFFCNSVSGMRSEINADFHVATAFGVLHHLDDSNADALVDLAFRALMPGGRLIAVDPCFADGQSGFAEYLIRRDRGQNVRRATEYRALAGKKFESIENHVENGRLRIPYTHHIMVCTKKPASGNQP